VVTASSVARLARGTVTMVLVVAGARSLLGVWLSSAVLALAGLGWLLRTWYRLERRLDAHERAQALTPEVMYLRRGPRPVAGERHLAFARALGAVAAAYESECQQEATVR
jgi:hypothetical protein